MLEGLVFGTVIADKGYDNEKFVKLNEQRQTAGGRPPKR